MAAGQQHSIAALRSQWSCGRDLIMHFEKTESRSFWNVQAERADFVAAMKSAFQIASHGKYNACLKFHKKMFARKEKWPKCDRQENMADQMLLLLVKIRPRFLHDVVAAYTHGCIMYDVSTRYKKKNSILWKLKELKFFLTKIRLTLLLTEVPFAT